MKKRLLKRCTKPVCGEQREGGMLIVGREMFDKKVPQRDIPMYCISDRKIIK